MSDTQKDEEFIQMADAFIALANKYTQSVDKGKVSAAFLYAAARFNTYVVAASAPDAGEFASYQENALAYFKAEYHKMLVEHFADYQQNFAAYLKEKTDGKHIN